MKKKMPIIVDCDPGDDAFALMAIKKYEKLFDLKLICSVAGNMPISIVSKNTKYFVKKLFNGVPFAKGEAKPLIKKRLETSIDVYKESGLGFFNPPNVKYDVEPDAVESMYRVLSESKEKVKIIAIGPATNVAKLLLKHPDCVLKIDEICAMIGSYCGKGNIKPFAEFNAYYDPHALYILAHSGVKITYNPLETGHFAPLKKEWVLNRESKSEMHDVAKKIIEGMTEPDDDTIARLYDIHSILALVKPSLYEWTNCDVRVYVDCEEEGKCEMTRVKKSDSRYIKIKNKEKIFKEIIDCLFE